MHLKNAANTDAKLRVNGLLSRYQRRQKQMLSLNLIPIQHNQKQRLPLVQSQKKQ